MTAATSERAASPALELLNEETTLNHRAAQMLSAVAELRTQVRGLIAELGGDDGELYRCVRDLSGDAEVLRARLRERRVGALQPLAELDRPGAVVASLTGREREVLLLLARGRSNRDISRALFVSESTAKFHVANIMRKFSVGRRAEAVYVAGRLGVL